MAATPRRRASAARPTDSTTTDVAPRLNPATTGFNERRERIVAAAMQLAARGGYEAVQMREVAERADVALATLYRYFPSKIHLLVAGLIREFEQALRRLQRSRIPGTDPYSRVLHVLQRTTRALQRNPQLTEAMTRAFMFADSSAAEEVETATKLAERFLTTAMTDGTPSEQQRAVARVITDVWMSNLVSWVTRRSSGLDMSERLELTVRLLLSEKDG